MHYEIEEDIQSLQQSEAQIIGFYSDKRPCAFVDPLNKQLNGHINRLIKHAKEKSQALIHFSEQNTLLIVVNLGESKCFSNADIVKTSQSICQLMEPYQVKSASLYFPTLSDKSSDAELKAFIETFDQTLYQFNHFKSDRKERPLSHLKFWGSPKNKTLLNEVIALNQGVRMCRDLGNTPANVCTPTYLAATAQQLSQQYNKLQCKILGPEEIHNLGMGAFLAVTAGSEQEPRLIELQFNNAGNAKPVILVGKGITFDSGGLTLKPGIGMQEMKYDMCGAASVLGVIKACAEMDLNVNLIGIIASAENMVSGKATRPGDIVTSMSGMSIEIINTDAEGRLVLADALTYAEQFDPEFVIDIATLTGAMVVALGGINTGFMTNDEALSKAILKASLHSRDRCWRMPLDNEYQQALESTVADMVNANFDRSAGSITAACFLSRFTKKYRWAHMDIAGTAWVSGKNINATGRPVPVLIELLKQYAHAS